MNINDYIDTLAGDLSKLDAERRIAFAAWCLESLLHGSMEELRQKREENILGSVQRLLSLMWECATSGQAIDQVNFDRLYNEIRSIHYRDEDDPPDDDVADACVIEMLNCSIDALGVLRNASPRRAADAARRVIHQADFEGMMASGASRELEKENNAIADEINRQHDMIEFLRGIRQVFKADRSRFSERYKRMG